MFIARLRRDVLVSLAGALLSLVTSSAIADTAPAEDACGRLVAGPSVRVAAEDPAWFGPLLDAMVANGGRSAVLERALARVPASQSAHPLVSRARLTLAALNLQGGASDSARTILLTIPLDSEAALDAGLLIAESWAMTGDLRAATRWNQRVAQHWPHEPSALDALVNRAAALAGQDRADALSVLIGAREQARQAASDLDALMARLEQEDWFSRWLADGGEPALDPQTAAVFYRVLASESFQAARGAALAVTQPGACARLQAARLSELQASIDSAAAGARHSLAALTAGNAELQHRHALARAAYLAGSGQDAALGHEVNQTRNALARNEAAIAALKSGSQSLPAARRKLAIEAARLEAVSAGVGEQAARDVADALHATIVKRRAMLMDIAGSASLHIGEIRDPRYSAR